jgi:bleomycin hydrolase
MKLFLVLFLSSTMFLNVFAQNKKDGAIDDEMLKRLNESVKMDNYTTAMQNAVSSNEISKLAFNRGLVDKIDEHFAHRIEIKGITNQKKTGRCWLFTGLNVLRPKVIKKYNIKEFEFSENYLFFWDQLEKSNLFLEAMLETKEEKIESRKVEWLFKHPVGDGGVWNMMVDLVEKYGMVPKEAMQESFNSENTRMMNRLIKRKLREGGIKIRNLYEKGGKLNSFRKEKEKILGDVYRILVISLGTPPQKFTWRYADKDGKISQAKEYTPMSFYKEIIETELKNYVMLMHDPAKEYYKIYEVEYSRNRYDGKNWKYINVPLDELKQFAKKSILADESMYFSCDVGKQLNREKGIVADGLYDYESIFGVKFGMTKKERIQTFESGSTHGMALVGVDTSSTGKTTKWLLENSWGKDSGFKGFLIMTDDWFDEYMFRLVIQKQFLPAKVLDVLKQKPILLPPWDPMS